MLIVNIWKGDQLTPFHPAEVETLCILRCMRRFQMYLTEDQAISLSRRAERDQTSIASVVRDAVERYLASSGDKEEPARVLEETFGASPKATTPPRREWDRLDAPGKRARG